MPSPFFLAHNPAPLTPAYRHFNWSDGNPGGCYTSTHHNGRYNGQALWCDDPRFPHCPSLPKSGCTSWQREAGADVPETDSTLTPIHK